MWKNTLLLIVIIISGCQSTNLEIKEHTLAGNPRIPVERIKLFYQGNNWDEVKNRPYDAYVILRGRVKRDRTVEINKVREYYPDNIWANRAQELAKHVRLSPTRIGSRVPPGAEVYVVFYESAADPHVALIFAKQTGAAAGSLDIGKTEYLTFYVYSSFQPAAGGDATR